MTANDNAVEPDVETIVKEHSRNKKKKGYKEELIKNLEIIEVPCELPEDAQYCPWCNTKLVPIGKETVRDELQFIPAQVKIIRYIRYAYECPTCRKDGVPDIGRDYCNQLFKNEEKLSDLKSEDRKIKRLELEKPVLEAFLRWLSTLNSLKGSRLGKAVTYASNQNVYMENYLLDGR